ncbi:MAG: Ig domain-containing protein [Lachnospiraceae bacterium]
MKNFKKLLVLAFALVVAATMGVSTTAEAAATFTRAVVTNTVTANASDNVMVLAKGKKAVLKGTSTPAVTPVFKSANTKIATVNSKGVVTAKAPGLTKVYVVFAKKGYKTVTKTVYVKVVKDAVMSVSLTNKTAVAGMTASVKSTVKTTGSTANKSLKWYTSNKNILKVDAKTGKFKALAAGKTYLYAKTTDGTGKVAKCIVTVKAPITSVGVVDGASQLYVGKAGTFVTKTNANAFNTKAVITVSKKSKVSATIIKVDNNTYKVIPNERGKLILTISSAAKNPNGKYVTKDIGVYAVDKDVVKVTPNVNAVATATVTGTPKAIAEDLEAALKFSGAKVDDIVVTIDGKDQKVVYDGKKVTVGGKWLGDVSTKTGKVSVKITEKFASYVKDMDVYAAFMGDKEYNFDITVGANKFTQVKSQNGAYVVATVNGKEYKMYNVGETLYIVGTKAKLGDLATDLAKVATLEDVPQ